MRLNNKGFAISGILYSMFILVITLMFLVLAILSGRRTTLNKVSQEASTNINKRVVNKVQCTNISFNLATHYNNSTSVNLSKGYYIILAWGGAGDDSKSGGGSGGKGPGGGHGNEGGNGAFVSTIYEVTNSSQRIYLTIGKEGNNHSGGGATVVATSSGRLSSLADSRLILVAAGGGAASSSGTGGAGGDLDNGLDGTGTGNGAGEGASDNSGGAAGSDTDTRYSGTAGSKGTGGKAGQSSGNRFGGAGGDGYYGGGGGASSSSNNGGGGGGVSYINDDWHSYTLAVLKNGGIFKTYTDYKTYVGVAVDGNSEMPRSNSSDKNSKLLTETTDGNDNDGYVTIIPLTCTK